MSRNCDFCSTSSAAIHCKADAAHLCLSCDAKPHASNQVVNRHPRTLLCDSCNCLSAYDDGCLDHGSIRRGLMCHLCDRSHHVTTSPVHHSRLSINSCTSCPDAEDFAAIWGVQMNQDLTTDTSSTSHEWNLDILGQILDLQKIQTTVPLGQSSNTTRQLRPDNMQDQLGVSSIPDDEYLAFLNLEELIGDDDDQNLIVRNQQLLDDGNENDPNNLDMVAASMDCPRESSSMLNGYSSCSSPSPSVLCNTLSSCIVSYGEQVFDARANAVTRYKKKKHSRVYERKIRYQKKKAIADARKRVRGRFARS